MRSGLRTGLTALLCGLTLCGLANTAKPPSSKPADAIISQYDLPQIIKQGTISVAIYKGDLKPYIYWQHARPYGIAVELARLFAHELNLKLQFVVEHGTFDGVIKDVNQHRVDMSISMLTRTTPRAVEVAFTKPYLTPRIWLLVDRLKFAGVSDAEVIKQTLNPGKFTYVTYPQSSYTYYLTMMTGHGPALTVRGTNEKIRAVEDHKVNFCMIDELSASYWLSRHPSYLVNVRPVAVTTVRDQLAMAVPYSSPILLSTANVFIDTIKLNGTMARMLSKYTKGALKLGKK